MKGALLKKRCGIPAALLLILLLTVAGTATAWYSFATNSSQTTVEEPLSTAGEEEFSAIMYPGESKTWSFDVVNSADVDYSVRADLTYSAPDGVSITDFTVDGADETADLLDDYTAEFSVPAGKTITCSMTITASNDAENGEVSASLDLSRG